MKTKLLRIVSMVINGILIGALLQPFFLSITLASSLGALSEQTEVITITGRVISEDDNGPLPGVNIILKGTRTGSVTDVDGKYKIEVPDENAVLVYSSIGFATQEITVGNRSTIDVTLASDIQALNEIVVVGYGSQEKKDVTGAIGSVSTEDFAAQPVTRIDQALQGRVAGVTVTNSSGAPGGTVSIRVRGANSITGNNDPLYVIDGFVGGDFNIVNPADIESIQVLKDASATAIYGSRGSNGVVLITTKSGVSGKSQLTFTARFSTSEVLKKWDLMDAGTFAEVANQRATAFGSTPKFTDADIASYKANGGTDWQDELFSRAAGQEYQLDYSGGNDAVKYFVSGNYYDQDGIVLNSGYERFSLRTNVNAKLSDKLTADIRLNFIRRETNNVGGAGTISGALAGPLSWSPTTPVRDANGNLTLFDPISSIKENPVELALNDYIQQRSTFLTYASLNYKIIDGLTFDVAVGFNYSNNQGKTFTQNLQNAIPAASRISQESIFLQNTNNLTYTKAIVSHKFTITGVLEHQQRTVDSFGANAQNLTFPELKYDNLTLAESSVAFAERRKESIRSYIGRVSYEFNDRYLIAASIRNDGSSKFRGDNQSSTFPSVALGWRLSEEDFLSGGFFEDLKLRGSWGQTGSQGIGVFGTVTTFATDIGEAGTSFTTGTTLPGIVIGNPGNSNLRWETTTQVNAGFDMQILKGRLALTMDYFVKNTTDLLLEEPLPKYVGGGNLSNNVGEVQNKGIEISIGSTIIDKENFRWSSNFNVSFLTNSVTDLGDREEIFFNSNVGAGLTGTNESIIRPGLPISSYWGVNYLGTWKTAEAVEAAVYGNVPGDSKYEDLNNDGVIDGEDFTVIGSGMPETILGWNNTLEYKNFSFNLFFMAMGGFDKWNLGYAQAILPNPDSFEATSVDILDRWVAGSNEGSNIPAFSPTSVDFFQSSRWVESGDFLRLKNVSLSYRLPKDLIKGIDAQFSIAGTNLWTLTNYKGIDPEAFSNNGEGDRS
ncbi:MAG: TonB-dependent receptor, partial [Cyclobacteriaceae bacterium]|nr:TonB-dependent receptor [Cyclobacteriaceae bacterium]